MPANTDHRQGFPVLPGALPVLGHMPSLYNDALGMLRRGHETLGPAFWVHFGFGAWRLFCLGKESFELLKHPGLSSEKGYADLRFIAGHSLIAQDGAAHRRIRTTLGPTFAPPGLAGSGAGELAAEVVTRWAEDRATRDHVVVLPEAQELALDILFRATGVRDRDFASWRKNYNEFALGVYPIPINLPGFPRHRSLRGGKALDEKLRELIATTRKNPHEPGMIHTLIDARDEEGRTLSDDKLVENLRFLFFAGQETSATTMAWMLIRLAHHRHLWDRLCDEVSHGAPAKVPTSHQEAREFPFAEALFRETLRYYSPVWFVLRETTERVPFGDRDIPPGVLICISPSALSRDPELFAEPERFDTGRWLGRSKPPSPLEISQFGGGPHFCLGYSLAWLEGIQFLVALARVLGPQGRRPRLTGESIPKQVFFPLAHPPNPTRIAFQAGP